MNFNEKINEELTDYIKKEVSCKLGIKSKNQANTDEIISRIEYLPFVDLGQMDNARYMIDSYSDEDIESEYPEIAKTLSDPQKEGYFADAMWNVLVGSETTYELDDEVEGSSNFEELLRDINDYLKD